MKIYAIVNPLDPYTFLAPDRQIAAIVIFLLSPIYGAKCLSHPGADEDIPVFALGSARQWWAHTFPGDDMEKVINARAREISESLSSILCGTQEMRKTFKKLYRHIDHPEILRKFQVSWNDRHRKSPTDIAKSAYATADIISSRKVK